MKWYEPAIALTAAGVAEPVAQGLISNITKAHEVGAAFPPNEPSIWFICLGTMTEVPIEMRLDDRLPKEFNLAICNFGINSGKPFIAAGKKGEKLRILFRSDVPLKHHQIINVFYVSPPTLREFFEAFNIQPDKSVIVEFMSGNWHGDQFLYNDFFWWQVNVID
ncbi:MAG: hypothetical protein DDT26_02280 [Dehalococcoidia bacterium]|nr:hypothetical protein [Chloroflexota bacterium]